jgi:hypothetical protein
MRIDTDSHLEIHPNHVLRSCSQKAPSPSILKTCRKDQASPKQAQAHLPSSKGVPSYVEKV